jgi:hypothetical protein
MTLRAYLNSFTGLRPREQDNNQGRNSMSKLTVEETIQLLVKISGEPEDVIRELFEPDKPEGLSDSGPEAKSNEAEPGRSSS